MKFLTHILLLSILSITLLLSDWGRAQSNFPTQVLKVAIQSDPRTLDPHLATEAASMRVIEPLYNSLMRYSEEYGKIEKDLVENYEVSPDQRKYTFKLKRGIKFHRSGREMKAKDVKFSLERIIKKKIRAYQFLPVEQFVIEGPYTLSIYLKKPFAPFLTYLAHPMNAIVDSEAVEKEGLDLKRSEAGTGAFQLETWKKNQYLKLKRNEDYFQSPYPLVEGLEFIAIPDETARSLALRTGEVVIILDVPPKEIPLLERNPQVQISSAPGTFWEYLGFQTQKTPFSNPLVRQAIAWTVDRSELNLMVKKGMATPLKGGPIPDYHWVGSGPPVYPQPDRKRAKQLLVKAGYPDGFQAELLVGSDFPYQVDAAQVVKQQLKEIGIRITIRSLESSLFFSRLAKGDFQMTLVGWVGFVDPDEWLYNLFHSKGIWNQQHYQNPQVDDLLETARATTDPAKRKELYQQIQGLVARDAPMVFIYINPQIVAYRKGIKDFQIHPAAISKALEKVQFQPEGPRR